MCSTPKPKTKVKGKTAGGGSLLSTMSTEARSRFAERANIAQERRDNIALKRQQEKRQHALVSKGVKKVASNSAKIPETQQRNLSYWFFKASVKDLFVMLFFGKSKLV
ncbi:hypothetical protein L3081_14760 [Colwellia sp. MSW7]|uniref:Small EDRK-rich factor-like N-terminal domain-containing protein n=1 Tax=Colwellia maritima TaxID=2912588 RepID=A0ABS9X2D6_9GAMM|nr:hypothetical protein [Colwellia maritima]MCI2284414.1 hypothetical protein [Colwellia maritima]